MFLSLYRECVYRDESWNRYQELHLHDVAVRAYFENLRRRFDKMPVTRRYGCKDPPGFDINPTIEEASFNFYSREGHYKLLNRRVKI